MAYTTIPGGMWVPKLQNGYGTTNWAPTNTSLLDADEEELQFIGRVYLSGGSGSKTFGTSGSQVCWLSSGPITFTDDGASDPTLRVGVKKESSIDATTGPQARATIGAAAFDVYDDLVGGTDTIAASTWRNDAMTAGTPFTVSHGDLIAICWHLDKPGAAAQAVRFSGLQTQMFFPTGTLVTSGPTYNPLYPISCALKFDDGTYGWIDDNFIYSNAADFASIGNTNLYGNLVNLPFDCKVDAIGLHFVPAGTTNIDVGFWSTPFGTPTPHTNGTLSIDPQIGGAGLRWSVFTLPTPTILTANTDYALAIKQNSASGITWVGQTVDNTDLWKSNGLDSGYYAISSTAGAAFSQVNSGKSRAYFFLRISAIDFPAGGGLITHSGMTGGIRG